MPRNMEESKMLHKMNIEKIRTAIQSYILIIGNIVFNDVSAVEYFNRALLMEDLSGWKLFASYLGLNKISVISLIENKCKLTATDDIMNKILKLCNPQPTWQTVLNSLLALGRYDILSGLLEKGILLRIKQKYENSSGYSSPERSFPYIHQSMVRFSVSSSESEEEFPKGLYEQTFQEQHTERRRYGAQSLDARIPGSTTIQCHSCLPSLHLNNSKSQECFIQTVNLLTPEHFSKGFSRSLQTLL